MVSRLRYSNANGKIRNDASETIKKIALRLFAERGVDGVTVREIATAASQKNHGAVGYYFNSKEALVREIISDGAKVIDERRNAMLDALEAQGGPKTVREVVEAIIYPSLEPFDDGADDCYMRLVTILNLTHRDLFTDAIESRWNGGYQRCLTHLRRLMPPLANGIKNQRLLFLGSYLAMVMALRQTALSHAAREHSVWLKQQTLDHLATTATAMLECGDPEPSQLAGF